MSDECAGGTEHEECHVVRCHEVATKTLRIERDYDSVSGETKTLMLEKDYCDEHADMWLGYDQFDGHRYEVIGDACSLHTGTER